MIETLDRTALKTMSEQTMRQVIAKAFAIRADLGTMEILDADAAKTQRPFGFDVHKAAREYLETKEFLERLESITTDSTHAIKQCEQFGLPVMAVVPSLTWDKICIDAGLFTLYPSVEGKVEISTDAYYEYAREAASKVNHRKLWGRKSYEEERLDVARAKRKALEHFFTKRTPKSVMHDLFPNHIGRPATRYGPHIVVKFPTPDEAFGKALLKMQKMRADVAIVVEPEAVDITQFVTHLLAEADSEIARLEHEVVEKRRRALAISFGYDPCPILVFPFNSVRVVVAQYGKWPLELKAIRTAIEHDLRLTFD